MSITSDAVGCVASLWRYPVKSMRGEEIGRSEVTERGLVGDRAYALLDRETGKLASAKNPRKWGRLLEFAATFLEPARAGGPTPSVRITFPDGTTVRSDEADLELRLRDVLGREITFAASAPAGLTLEAYWPGIEGHEPLLPPVITDEGDTITEEPTALGAPPGTFFDFAPVHMLTTATLDRLGELYAEGRFDVRRFRPNVVVDVRSEKGFVENAWCDRVVAIGDEVRLRVIIPDPRCVMTTLPQGDLPKDPGILRTIARHNRIPVASLGDLPSVGVYAQVVTPGAIRRGDRVRLE